VLAGVDVELGHDVVTRAVVVDVGVQGQCVGPGEGGRAPPDLPETTARRIRSPAAAAARCASGPPGDALDAAVHVGVVALDRHAVDDPDHPVGGGELSFQHQRLGAVAARGCAVPTGGGEQPAAVLALPEQRGEACPGIEPGQAQPVDRPGIAHKGAEWVSPIRP